MELGRFLSLSIYHVGDESWWRLFPIDVDYYVYLGDFFESGMTTDGSFPRPKFQCDSYNDRTRAVRKDLCVHGTIGATEVCA